MWHLNYANRKCNEFEKQREHLQHLERITNIKSAVDKKEPKKPTFLFHKSNKISVEQINWKKTFYENTVILKKILEIENKPSTYHPVNLKIKKCPAYEKTDYVNKEKRENIHRENAKLYRRLVSAKTHYSTEENIKNYKYTNYISTLISNTKNNINPNVMNYFDTPSTFKRKYTNHLLLNSMANSTSNNPFTVKNITNTKLGGTTLYEDSHNFESNMKNNIYLANANNVNYVSTKKKNILAAIDINKNYYDRKRPYSANKPEYLNKYSNKTLNLNNPRSAKNKAKANNNLDLGNYKDLRNINADYYQALIDKITKEYGEIDAEMIQEYIRNLEKENNIQRIIDENTNNNDARGNNDEHRENNHKDLINNHHEISEINAKNNSEALQQQREDIGDENEENFYNQDFENN